jgi:hypothetical protein
MIIEYRAKDYNSNEWIYGLPYSFDGINIGGIKPNNSQIKSIKRETLGQNIGLRLDNKYIFRVESLYSQSNIYVYNYSGELIFNYV